MEKKWRENDILLNTYEIEKVISANSFLAKHSDWDRLLWIKRIDLSLFPSETARQQFLTSLSSWISLPGSRRLGGAYYQHHQQQILYLIGEYLQGKNLLEKVHEGISPAELYWIATEVGLAINESWALGHPYGNLNWESIFLTPQRRIRLTKCYSPLFSGPELFHHYQKFINELFSHHNVSLPEQVIALFDSVEPDNFATWSEQWQQVLALFKQHYEQLSSQIYPLWIEEFASSQELHNKLAFTFLADGQQRNALVLWKKLAEEFKSSLARWNQYLFEYRKGLQTHQLLSKAVGQIASNQERARILVAYAHFSLETGLALQETSEKLAEYLQNHNQVPNEVIRAQAKIFLQQRRFLQAAEVYQHLSSLEALQPQDWYWWGVCFFEQKDPETAQLTWQQGLEKFPSNQNLLLARIWHAWQQRDFQECEQLFSQITENNQDYPLLLHQAEFFAGYHSYSREQNCLDKERAAQCYSKLLQQNITLRAVKGAAKCAVPLPEKTPCAPSGWSQLYQIAAHPNLITSLAVSQDEKLIAVGDCDQNIALWQRNSSHNSQNLVGHSKHISDLAFSSDNRYLVSGSWDRTVCLWDVSAGECLKTLSNHQDKVSCVTVSQQGEWLASGGWDGKVYLWNKEQDTCHEFSPEEGWITDIALDPKGQWLLYGTEKEQIYLHQTDSQQRLAILHGDSILLTGAQQAISSSKQAIYLWELPEGKCLKTIPTTSKEICMQLTPDELFLLTKNEDDIFKFWFLPTGQCVMELNLEDVLCAWLIEGGKALIATHGNMLHLWENTLERTFPLMDRSYYLLPPTAMRLAPPFVAKNVRKAELFLQEQKYSAAMNVYRAMQKIPGHEKSELLLENILIAAQQGNLKRVGVQKVWLTSTLFLPETPEQLQLSAEGALLFCSTENHDLAVYNLKSTMLLKELKRHKRIVSGLFSAPGFPSLISSSWDGTLHIWDRQTFTHTSSLSLEDNQMITALAVCRHTQQVLTGTRNGSLYLWDLKKNHLLEQVSASSHCLCQIIPVEDESKILVTDRKGEISLWQLPDLTCQKRFRPHTRKLSALTLAPYASLAASASRSGDVLIWDINTFEIVHRLSLEETCAHALHFVPQSQMLIIAGNDGNIHFWDYPKEQLLISFLAHESPCCHLKISANQRYLLTSDTEGKIALWEVDWQWQK